MFSASRYSAKSSSAVQFTLAILKPDVCKNPKAREAIQRLILEEGFSNVKDKEIRLSLQQAEKFYEEHKDRFFYNRLTTFISSGLISVHVLARENAIAHWRKLLGPTKVYRTIFDEPQSLRGMYGLTDTRNSGHGSDSPETAFREIKFFFPDFIHELGGENR
ncbi:Nucleoside diphosphate kinase 6 [Halotydeus destructor]|nr:Nucleoside diphosphate kinase 6 [Halotydeus destructor]